jgi:selenoprotein W-related protein
LTSKLLTQFKQQIRDLKLIPAGGGCFELSANGTLIYSKLETGEFPNENAILDKVKSLLSRQEAGGKKGGR